MSFTNLTSLHLWPTHYQNLHLFTLAYTSGTTCLPWFTPVAHYQHHHLFTLAYTCGPLSASSPVYPGLHLWPTISIITCLPWLTPVAHYQHHHLFTLAYTCGPLSASPPFALAYICDPCFYPSLHLQPTSSITTCFP